MKIFDIYKSLVIYVVIESHLIINRYFRIQQTVYNVNQYGYLSRL